MAFEKLELHGNSSSVEMYQQGDLVVFEDYQGQRPETLQEMDLFIKFSIKDGWPLEVVSYGGSLGDAVRQSAEVVDKNERLKLLMTTAIRIASRTPAEPSAQSKPPKM